MENDQFLYEEELPGDDLEVDEPMKLYDEARDFTSLDAWKKAREVKLFFYSKIIPQLPPEEKYNLNLQIRKGAVSGTANIEEGKVSN